MQNNEWNKKAGEFWFKALESKISFLPLLTKKEFNERSLEDEAYILCIVYLDWLSSGYKNCTGDTCDLGSSKTDNKRSQFYRMLTNYSEEPNPLFKKIDFCQLISDLRRKNRKNRKSREFSEKLCKFFNLNANLYIEKQIDTNENETDDFKKKSMFSKMHVKEELINFLKYNIEDDVQWLEIELDKGVGSVAYFVYDQIRNPAVHQWGRSGVSIEGITISFELLYSSLVNIYKYVKNDYEKTGRFLGHHCNHWYSFTQTSNEIQMTSFLDLQ